MGGSRFRRGKASPGGSWERKGRNLGLAPGLWGPGIWGSALDRFIPWGRPYQGHTAPLLILCVGLRGRRKRRSDVHRRVLRLRST